MKFVWFSFGLLALLAGQGCVRSHRGHEVVYYTPAPAPPSVPPVYTPIAPPLPPPPTSRAEVYTVPPEEAGSPLSAPPPRVSDRDIALAESISKLLKNDSHMATISENVQTTVDQGVVTLQGTAPSGNAIDEIAMRVAKLPGVVHLSNHLSVSNR